MIDPSALKNEIQNDPLGLGYAGKQDTDIAALLNATTGPGAATIGLPTVTKGEFLAGILPALLVLPTKDTATQQKWDRILAVVRSVDQIDLTSSNAQGLFGMAVSDGILTQAQIAAVTTKTGSRAEVLFGAGTVVTMHDVGVALRQT